MIEHFYHSEVYNLPGKNSPYLVWKKKKKNSWHLIPSVMKEARLIVFSVSKIHKNMDYRVFIWKKKNKINLFRQCVHFGWTYSAFQPPPHTINTLFSVNYVPRFGFG